MARPALRPARRPAVYLLLLLCSRLAHALFSQADADVAPLDPALRPHDLTAQTFDAEMSKFSPQQPVVVEFYASWCPACKHFQPAFFRVAAFFHAEPRVRPRVEVARVDCATEAGPSAPATRAVASKLTAHINARMASASVRPPCVQAL